MEPATLTVGLPYQEGSSAEEAQQLFENMSAEFLQNNDGIELQIQAFPEVDYEEELKAALDQGTCLLYTSRCPYCGISLITEEDKKDTFLTGDETILQSELEDDGGRTVAFWGNESGEDYVTGWLVCVAGPEKGRDFRLHYGFNRIGRSYQMDICCLLYTSRCV